MSILKVSLLAAVFLTPLLGSVGDFGFEQIKVLFFILSISLIGFIWLLQKQVIKWDLIKIASFLFILTLFITSGLGLDFEGSFLGKEPYFQGLVLYACLFLFSLFVSSMATKLESVTVALTGSALVVSLVAIQDWILLNIFNQPIQTYAGRVVSTFDQPNFYAGFLLLSLPFIYLLFKDKRRKLQFLGWGSGLVLFIGILVSYSRVTILMALVLLIFGLVDQLRIKFKLGLIVFGIILLGGLGAFVLSSGIVGNEFVKPFQTINPDLTKESVEKRAYIWPQALIIAWQKPLTGYGLENINKAFSSYFEANKHLLFEENLQISPVLISLKELNIDRSHNYILDLLLFAGVPGLLAWIFLITVLLLRSRGILLVSFLTYLVWIQFQNQSIVHLIYFWFLVGLINQDKP